MSNLSVFVGTQGPAGEGKNTVTTVVPAMQRLGDPHPFPGGGDGLESSAESNPNNVRQVQAVQNLKCDLEACSALGINLAKVSVQAAQ